MPLQAAGALCGYHGKSAGADSGTTDRRQGLHCGNEMVFSYLLKHLEQKNVTLLCTSGQLRSAAVKLIPFLLNSGAEIYYSGDIDPDGIRIADRLWRKYGDRIHVWRMSKEDYTKSLSEEEIGNISMKSWRLLRIRFFVRQQER